jgi:DNA-binding MarR family transcriptional regulator
MTNNPKLNDFQLVLLSTAAQRDDGGVFPVAESIAENEDRVRKAVESLLKRSLVEEGPTTDRRLAWREHDDRPIAVFITAAGRSLIDRAADHAEPHAGGEKTAKNEKASVEPVRTGSKKELVLGLLRRPVGATLDELVTATGWLPHTTRAALTGLRKKGHVVEKTKRDDSTCYRVAEVA